MARILVPLPRRDFDPTEAGVPWRVLRAAGHTLVFATPDGRPASADPRMLEGRGLGPWKALLVADRNGREAYEAMAVSTEFRQPLAWPQLEHAVWDALLLPGGHAPGMKEYLESPQLQTLVAQAFAQRRPVGAICHGVLLAARSRRADGRSVLQGLRTTALLRSLELSAWALTAAWLGSYYRTYPQTVQDEVRAALARPQDFVAGPPPLRRDSPAHLERGFSVRDGVYLSARWPGDAHRFSADFAALLAQAAA
jgi:protease I